MSADTTTPPRVYVGTYAKYNAGSIAGAWLDLEDYPDKSAFLAACAALHADESDPELMFQDFEGFPRRYYGECSLADSLWDWLALDADDRELLAVYVETTGNDGADIDEARENFLGRFDSAAEWAEGYLGDCGELEDIPERLRHYFDFEAYARDAGMSGDVSFTREGGEIWVFRA